MSVKPKPSVVIFVNDVQRVSTFYRELAPMQVVHEDDDHIVLEIDSFQLVVHLLPGEPPVARDENGHPSVRQDCYIKLCLPVASIRDARSVASHFGGGLHSADHEWEAREFRACEGYDPEGNVIQVREPAR